MTDMSRRTFNAATLGCLGAVLNRSLPAQTASEGDSSPPNIVFLLTDDQRWDALGCMGNALIHTPHLDAMAKDGVVFDNAYVTTSICAPSRATILSGQYVCRHGIDNFSKTFTQETFLDTYPALLRAAGYATGFVGKYGIGAEMPEDEFDYWRGYAGQGHYEQQDEQGNPVHLTQVHENQALEFLELYGNRQPFCLSVSFKAPHCQDGDPRQFIYDPRYADLYKEVEIPVPENLTDTYHTRFPEFFRNNNEARNRWEIRFSTPEQYQEMVKSYYRLITGVDRVVGAIREKLAALNLAKDTIIVFTSDNGFFLGDHGLAGKWYGYEPSIRVPLVIYDPRLPQELRGVRRTQMALNLDMAPTLLSYAGVQPPSDMQGKNLLPVLLDDSHPLREDFFYEHTFEHPGIPKSEGVVSLRHKYLRYYEQEPVYEELFDLQQDPFETFNLAGKPEYSSRLEKMRERCEEFKKTVCA